MNVLMLGWEYPPFISGGLGTACHGLTSGLSALGVEVTFVIPRPVCSTPVAGVKLTGTTHASSAESHCQQAVNVHVLPLDVAMYPYSRPGQMSVPVGNAGLAVSDLQLPSAHGEEHAPSQPAIKVMSQKCSTGSNYCGDVLGEVNRYASLACNIAEQERFCVVHAHDWMTFPAGVAVARRFGKPLIVHVHSTEFDRSGEHVNQQIYDIERMGMQSAARVIAVSRLTKRICTERYGVPEDKVSIVYNAVKSPQPCAPASLSAKGDKIVLFLGRITMQKGPEYFLGAARRVLQKMQNVKFVMAGTGDLTHQIVELAAEMGIGHKVLFAGFLSGREVARAFGMASLYVMPSVSEPFGIAALEALSHDVPILISKQSGVSEVVNHALKVDFWDVDEMANKILAVLKHPPLGQSLRENGSREVRKFSWVGAAKQCRQLYYSVHCQAIGENAAVAVLPN